MKIGDVKVGEQYAIQLRRHSDYRRAEALGIVTVPTRVYDSAREQYKTRNERLVLLKALDAPEGSGFGTVKKGEKFKANARELVPWSELGPGIIERKERKEREEALAKEAERRIKKLLGRNYDGYVTCSLPRGANLDVWGKSLTKLLDLAELGLNRVAQTRPVTRKKPNGRVANK